MLWDDCLEKQAYIFSMTARDIFTLNNETPDALLNGETPDSSEFDESKSYDWVKYRDQQIAFPEDNFVLGYYLAPRFDIGPAMMAKILRSNGNYAHRSTFRHLTEQELQFSLEKKIEISMMLTSWRNRNIQL